MILVCTNKRIDIHVNIDNDRRVRIVDAAVCLAAARGRPRSRPRLSWGARVRRVRGVLKACASAPALLGPHVEAYYMLCMSIRIV